MTRKCSDGIRGWSAKERQRPYLPGTQDLCPEMEERGGTEDEGYRLALPPHSSQEIDFSDVIHRNFEF